MEIKKIESKKKSNSPKKPLIIAKKTTKKETPKSKRPNNNKPIVVQKVKKKKGNVGKVINGILSFFMFFGIVGMIAVIAFCGYIVVSAPAFNTDLLYSNEASIFYDKNGDEYARVGAEQRELVYYEDLPEVLVDAIVATEDSRYFQHNGFDVVRFAKAAFGQVVGQSGAGGASTLTMQVVKNTFTSTEASGWDGIIRKFTDIYMSIFLVEKNYTKEEIIEFYVNDPYLGASSYGVEQASKSYFGKSVRDLTLTEAALLAGVFNAPGSYDPYVNPDLATQRRNTVLNLMVRHGYISEEEAENAKAITVESLLVGRNAAGLNKYQQFIDIVCRDIYAKYKLDPYATPMEVYTTMDPKLQQVMIDLNEQKLGYKFPTYRYNAYRDNIQIGAVVTSVKDGSIAAVNGGRKQTTPKAYGRADMMKTQIGSTAKPIFAYGPYIEYNNGHTGTMFFDNKMNFSNGTPLKNSDGTYKGAMTMRQALAQSRNIPAVQAFQAVNKTKIAEFVHNVGLDFGSTLYESHAIGGGLAYSPIDMAGAYGAFARNGYYIEPYCWTKFVIRETDEVTEEKYTKTKAMSSETAYLITDMLITTTKQWGGSRFNVSGTDVALKSGTSTWSNAALKANGIKHNGTSADNWAVSYSPDYVIALWYGVDKLGPKDWTVAIDAANNVKTISGKLAQKIYPKNSQFKKPSGVISAKYEEETYPPQLPSSYTPDSLISTALFKKGTEPSEVSDRFEKLSNPTGGSISANGTQINLSWTGIKTPNAINESYLKSFFSENYGSFASTYFKKRLSYNEKSIGNLGYQVYLQTDTGLQSIGFTTNPYYTYQATTSGTYTFVIKSAYSIFKSNMSNGITLSTYVTVQNTPQTPPIDPGTPEIPTT
ncbi:MAG: transglycosylase domain-containing protein [Bacilli bacterium]|nr:transglycosylase domain-containing protein [Bacilli bacterium]